MSDFKYDLAISCLNDDEPLARHIRDRLEGRMGPIFLYTTKQEDLVGLDGVDIFSQTFRASARMVLVVYREGWGSTKWTRIEETAIRERYLEEGADRIVVYSTDGKAPVWFPTTRIWAGDRYGLDGLAAVLETKVQDLGGQVGEEDPVAMAARLRRIRDRAERRQERRFSAEAVHAAIREASAISAHLEELATSISDEREPVVFGHLDGIDTAYTADAAVGTRWEGTVVNSVIGQKLVMYLSSDSLGYYGWRKRPVGSYELELAEDESSWEWLDEEGRHFTSRQIASLAFRLLLEEHHSKRVARLEKLRRG